MTQPHRIAVVPGDGIGKEVVPEGLRVLDAVSRKFGINLTFDRFDWSCDYYLKHGSMMPADWKTQIGSHDAIFFGAVGWPAAVPDHISLWGMLVKFRREFDQYVSLRPVRLMPGVPSPLAGRQVGDIDFYVVRENTEGEYSSIGGRIYEGTDREVVASNPFGDILSDLGPACTGTIGIAPSANLNAERQFPSLFEPVHGSAPDIYGKGIANPIGQIWAGSMMLEHLGHPQAAAAVMKAIEAVLAEGPRTPDMGGNSSTEDVGRAVASIVQS